jgi:hypothetical protein
MPVANLNLTRCFICLLSNGRRKKLDLIVLGRRGRWLGNTIRSLEFPLAPFPDHSLNGQIGVSFLKEIQDCQVNPVITDGFFSHDLKASKSGERVVDSLLEFFTTFWIVRDGG